MINIPDWTPGLQQVQRRYPTPDCVPKGVNTYAPLCIHSGSAYNCCMSKPAGRTPHSSWGNLRSKPASPQRTWGIIHLDRFTDEFRSFSVAVHGSGCNIFLGCNGGVFVSQGVQVEAIHWRRDPSIHSKQDIGSTTFTSARKINKCAHLSNYSCFVSGLHSSVLFR